MVVSVEEEGRIIMNREIVEFDWEYSWNYKDEEKSS